MPRLRLFCWGVALLLGACAAPKEPPSWRLFPLQRHVPHDGPEQLAAQAQHHGWSFPYLLDQQQTLARALRAACTPEFYLFSTDGEGLQSLRYRGQLDGSRPGNDHPRDGRDLRAALDAVLTGSPVNPDQTASVGCNVKWNPGHEPEWFGRAT